MADPYARPATPQAMVHRRPDKSQTVLETAIKPNKFIVLISASTAVAGKVQVARSVANALSVPLFQGDSLHETAARASVVGISRRAAAGSEASEEQSSSSGANEARYQRMWLSKLTRTGLLFPEESRAAGAGFSGFGGAASSTAGSRRGSSSSNTSEFSTSSEGPGSVSTIASSVASLSDLKYTNRPPPVTANPSGEQKLRQENPALMVLTHPELEGWHRRCIRDAVGEYGIGVIFVPLDEDAELPILQPLDPRTMTSFGSFDPAYKRTRDWTDETALTVDVEAKVEEIADEITVGVREIMYV